MINLAKKNKNIFSIHYMFSVFFHIFALAVSKLFGWGNRPKRLITTEVRCPVELDDGKR